MNEKYNLKSIVAGLVCLIIGIIFILLDIFSLKTSQNLWISIGCSLIASGVVILLTALFVERIKVNPLDKWGIDKIYATRSEKNADSDPNLDKAQYCVDGIAFGLTSFRSKYTKKVEQALRKGVKFRIITMNPTGDFIHPREKEEGEVEGNIQESINKLVEWANDLNKKKYKGRIEVKAYDCMTLDFYWRVDNTMYIGPYWYGYKSGDTITYRFQQGGKAFSLYSDYFDSLWDNEEITHTLTEKVSMKNLKGKRR